MSLRWFHVAFITICVGLSVLVAAWAVEHGHWALSLVVLAGGAALVVYRTAFLQKAQKIGL